MTTARSASTGLSFALQGAHTPGDALVAFRRSPEDRPRHMRCSRGALAFPGPHLQQSAVRLTRTSPPQNCLRRPLNGCSRKGLHAHFRQSDSSPRKNSNVPRQRRICATSAESATFAASPSSFIASEGMPAPLHMPPPRPRFGPKDFAVISLCFVACAISAAFSVVLMAAVPALLALRRAALAIEQLAVTARDELPGTMAAVRLSGMEISDLTMELSDLSQEITEGVRTSTRAVKAAEDGLKRMKSYAQSKTVAALEERASLPVKTVRPPPYVAKAARQSKEAVAGARSVVSQASLLGNVWKLVPFGKNQDTQTQDERSKHTRGQYS